MRHMKCVVRGALFVTVQPASRCVTVSNHALRTTHRGWAEWGAGVTLLELVVVLAILGLILGISGLAVASLQAPRESAWVRELAHARAEAIRTGLPVRTAVASDTGTNHAPRTTHSMLFLPDGRAIGTGVDPLTGAPRATR